MLNTTSSLTMLEKDQIDQIVSSQRTWFFQGKTLDIGYRLNALKRLKTAIEARSEDIHKALKADLGKSEFEAYVSETGFVLGDIDHTIKKLRKWARPKRVSTPMVHWPSRSEIHYEPYGVTLVIGPWNYPFQLAIAPLVGALAAGNTCVIKPSEVASQTAKITEEIIKSCFEPEYVAVVQGAVQETTWLLDNKFDYIFYTGNGTVGRIVMEKASKHLTPVTLELGGKSPCIVTEDVDLDVACRRIAWGKFINAGQTCVAPDYILVDKRIKQSFVEKMRQVLDEFFPNGPKQSPDYARIIDERHVGRLQKLFRPEDCLLGGEVDSSSNYIAPTLINADKGSEAMRDEIFGPILPIIETSSISDAVSYIRKGEKPLALYLFSNNKAVQDLVLRETSSGGMLINDTILHLSNPNLPFGGVGESGMGGYHGHYSFETFSHHKAVMRRSFWFDVPIKYPPYFGKLKWIKILLKWLG